MGTFARHGQQHARLQAASGRILEHDLAAVALHDGLNDRQSEIHPAGRAIVAELDLTIGIVIDNRHQHLRQVEMGGGLRNGVVAEEGERTIHHGLHFIDIPKMPGLLLRVINQLTAQPHPRERCAQVVRDRREHQGSLREEPLYLRLHFVGGPNHLSQFAWT